ncbi:MAG: hypothetical protein AB7P31_05520 [Steroidobacteraceae bacterium]
MIVAPELQHRHAFLGDSAPLRRVGKPLRADGHIRAIAEPAKRGKETVHVLREELDGDIHVLRESQIAVGVDGKAAATMWRTLAA